MTTVQLAPDVDDVAGGRPRSTWQIAWQKLSSRPFNVACACVVALFVLTALASFTPYFASKATEKFTETYSPPSLASPGRWLGTDIQGQSVFWRVLFGCRIALIIAFFGTAMETTFGMVFGVLAGYFGGWIDDFIVWLFTTLNTVPWILLVIAMTYALKGQTFFGYALSDLTVVILALGLTSWTGLCRLVRGEVMRVRSLDYVMAARALGIKTPRILFGHVMPQVLHLAIINASLAAIGYVQAEVILSFLGLGITRDPSWGRMIDDAKLELLRGVWWQLIAATAAIFILCLALNFLGDALRDALDPRLTGVN